MRSEKRRLVEDVRYEATRLDSIKGRSSRRW